MKDRKDRGKKRDRWVELRVCHGDFTSKKVVQVLARLEAGQMHLTFYQNPARVYLYASSWLAKLFFFKLLLVLTITRINCVRVLENSAFEQLLIFYPKPTRIFGYPYHIFGIDQF